MAKWVARRIRRVHMSAIGSTQTAGRPRATAPRRAKTGIRNRESGRAAKMQETGGTEENPLSDPEAETATARQNLKRPESDGQNQIEKAEAEAERGILPGG